MEDLTVLDDQVFFSVVQSINSAVILHDRHLKVIFVNAVFEVIFDIPKEDVLGKSPMEFLPDFDATHRYAIQARLRKTLESGKKSPYHEFPYYSPTGKLRYLLAISIPVFDPNKEITHVMSLIHDVTPQKELEKEVLKAAKLSSLADMAYSLAHEINNPLTGIKLGLATLYCGLKKPENIQVVDSVMKDLNRIQYTVRSFLREKKNGIRLKKCMIGIVGDIFDDVLFHLSGQLDLHHISIEKTFCRGSHAIVVDRERLYEVFLNVMLNAIQAISEKGEIHIAAKLVCPESGEAVSEELLISIADTGIGMDEALQTLAFKPFHTTREGGTGLGLSICRKHIEQHGGRMELTSVSGQGTIVSIYLPIADGEG